MVRKSYNLDGGWFIAKDPCDEGRANGWEREIQNDAIPAFVPSIIQQFFPEYHGLAYYWCSFEPDIDTYEGGRVLLRFGGVDYKCDVWLNGIYLGSEEGGETPFSIDVTSAVRIGEKNLLAVRVLNPCEKTIDGLNLMNTPHRNKIVGKRAGSCLNHGGIWYEVSLHATPSVYIDDVFVNPDYSSGKVDIKVSVCASADSYADISASVFERCEYKPLVARESISANFDSGISIHEFSLKIDNFKAWDLDNPNLYEAKIEVSVGGISHEKTVRLGFREFCVKDGFFYLNGKKILLKSSHSGNAFPIGQMLPQTYDYLHRDFIYAKSCGFNMIREISGLFRPEQLELADEIGLLIYEESFASWCLGYSHLNDWANEEEYKKLEELHPEMLLGDENAMLSRWVASTEKMILRDRNHPSVVIWGLLNETKNNSVFRTARDFLPRLRELDPSRLVLLSSGRWDRDMSVGSVSNPYSDAWEKTWGIEGRPELYAAHIAAKKHPDTIMPDNHYYAPYPFKPEDKAIYRSYGSEYLPVFLSEFGHSSPFNVIDEIKNFRQFGAREDLEDYSWIESQAKAFERDFERLGLNKTFAFPEHVFRESQRMSAMSRREIFDVVRSNPRLCGYSLTGLLDHGWCGEGLWSYWRWWKPEMFDNVSDGWARLRFCLFASHNVYNDEPITLEAVLANDGILRAGEYTANFAITSAGTPVYTFSCKFSVDADSFAVPIIKKTLDIKLPEGEYEFCADMDGAAPRANKITFTVKDRAHLLAGGASLCALGLNESSRKLIESAGAILEEFNEGDTPNAIIVGSCSPSEIQSSLAAAKRGSKVFFLDWHVFENEDAISHLKEVIPDASFWYRYDWLYHKEIILNDKDIFKDLGRGLADGRNFTREWAKTTLKTNTTPDYAIAPAFEAGSHIVGGSYYLVYALCGYNFGEGSVFVNTFEVADNIGLPSADRLLVNIVNYLCK